MTTFMLMQNPATVDPGGPNPSYTRVLSMGPSGGSDTLTTGFIAEFVIPALYGFRNGTVVSTTPVPVNTPYIAEYQSDGTNLTGYLNGTRGDYFPSSGNFNIGKYRIGGTILSDTTNFSTGYISEVLIYKTSLTTTQRQMIEGYLAWRWSLQSLLPQDHPYKTTPVPNSG
jgi:hypothetical protein